MRLVGRKRSQGLSLAAATLTVAGVLISNQACRAEHPASPSDSLEPSASAERPTHLIEQELDQAISRAATEDRPIFVHFTAEWCLPCKKLKESVYPNPTVASRLAQFVQAEVDIESESGKMAAMRHRVQTVPVLMTMSPRGEEFRTLRSIGMRTPDQLVETLDEALKKTAQLAPASKPVE